jgi:hypothetical protein
MGATVIEFEKLPLVRREEPITETGPGQNSPYKSPKGTKADFTYTQKPRQIGLTATEPIDIGQLYAAPEAARPDFLKLQTLLADAISFVSAAKDAYAAGQLVDADTSIVKFQMMLDDLFGCRTVGDGYGTIVNSLLFAFINQAGKPLSEIQILTLWRVLRQLKSRPFLNLEAALEQIDELTTASFLVDPPVLGEMLPISND